MDVCPATAERWPDVERVFGTRGDPARCWCQWFFVGAEIAKGAVAEANRAALRAQVESGPPPGVLAYRDGEPAGWCAVAPRPGYGRLHRGQFLRGTPAGELADTSVWSVTCFVVPVPSRRQGVAAALLGGAVAYARDHGACEIEGYPVDVDVTGTTAAAQLYQGPLSVFLRAGFREVGRPRPARPVVRLAVGRSPA